MCTKEMPLRLHSNGITQGKDMLKVTVLHEMKYNTTPYKLISTGREEDSHREAGGPIVKGQLHLLGEFEVLPAI